MPDITRDTVSASQIPALFGMSPYATRWMLYQKFIGAYDHEVQENDRMDWGRRLEPVILRAAADELRCEVLAHDQLVYLRHPTIPVGCTPDGYVFDPQRGLGVIEAKNIDWLRWKETWDDTRAADHVEVQLQTQLMTPHPDHGMPKWGCIAGLIGGNELKLYERQPLADVHASIAREATAFLADVKARREPEVLGSPLELPALATAYPFTDKTKVLTEDDLGPQEALRVARLIEAYEFAKEREAIGKKEAESIKAELLALARDCGEISAHRRYLRISKSQIAGRTQVVKPYTMTRLTVSISENAPELGAIAAAQTTPQSSAFDLPEDIAV